MAYKNKAEGAAAVKAWYEKNKERTIANVRRNNVRYKARVDALKAGPCADCGQRYPPCVMDFDHRDGETKSFNVASINTWSMAVVAAEIAKCDLVCSNCHRIRTWNRSRSPKEKAQAS